MRLEEILIDDALCLEDYDVQMLDEQRQRMLMEEDENEDFLVEGLFLFFNNNNVQIHSFVLISTHDCSQCQSIGS